MGPQIRELSCSRDEGGGSGPHPAGPRRQAVPTKCFPRMGGEGPSLSTIWGECAGKTFWGLPE